MKKLLVFVFTILLCNFVYAQEGGKTDKKEVPSYQLFRAEERYDFLKNKETNPYEKSFFEGIKFIPLNKNGEAYLSMGGEIRPRFEHYSNRFWEGEEDQDFYSQRLAFHANLIFNKNIRVFTELYHGYTSHEEEFVEYDRLDFHQLFTEIIFLANKNRKFSFRFGRQEIAYGATRLIGLREGPNIRRSFDMVRLNYKLLETKIHIFYGKEVRPLFRAFDNQFTLFDKEAVNPKLWGVYSQFRIKGLTGKNELYYLGFETSQSAFSDVSGKETRHSIGFRRFGSLGKRWKYNTEFTYQFGEIGSYDISAYNIETDWHYKLIHTLWTPSIGLKLDYVSGDKKIGDQKLNTFNPMFVNPAFYSLAATITPSNIVSVHPSISLRPTAKLKMYAEVAFFWRASIHDGLYRPPRFLLRPISGTSDKDLGQQFGFKLEYEISRQLSFDLDMSYFLAGGFQKATGASENVFHIAPTVSYKF